MALGHFWSFIRFTKNTNFENVSLYVGTVHMNTSRGGKVLVRKENPSPLLFANSIHSVLFNGLKQAIL